MTYTSIRATAPTAIIPATEQRQLSPTATVPTVKPQPLSNESAYENRFKAALEHARRLTQMHNCESADVAIAWETVEELRSAQLRQPFRSVSSCVSMFERYCADNPSALECRSYDC